ncbi:NADH dehydrogenase subunit 6 (mitochondrion) [Paramicrosporidium saccamoebae]|uniref:Uncharacterized protein n=1 Tax=Paramicrosporidium saccamoebae TaxID=1246581 RepID=A0A2H9TR20_9FUNG|nr:NADH dehydrogenase subunit 6 [Paramicrosporidium saccamoebae]
MDQIFFLFLLFSFLFLIETKAINILICFVGIMITVALQLSLNFNLSSIDGQYFSYILILVQVSALTILFGFIIMLYPSLSISTPTTSIVVSNNKFENLDIQKGNKLIITLLFFFFLFNSVGIYFYGLDFYSFFFTTIKQLIPQKEIAINFNIEEEQDTLFIRKLGYYLYSDSNNILKLIFLTIILLFAIIALFFLV